MEVILLERVAKLGQMGDVVRVKDGFARNFLLPHGKALRATDDNKAQFEGMKAELQATQPRAQGRGRQGRRQARRQELRRAAPGLRNRPALRLGVAARHRRRCSKPTASTINRIQIALNAPIKTIGQHKVPVALHPEVEVTITVIVARSADEAERIARGEDVTVRREDAEEEARSRGRQAARRSLLRAGSGRRRRGRSRPEAAEATAEAEAEAKPAKAKARGRDDEA